MSTSKCSAVWTLSGSRYVVARHTVFFYATQIACQRHYVCTLFRRFCRRRDAVSYRRNPVRAKRPFCRSRSVVSYSRHLVPSAQSCAKRIARIRHYVSNRKAYIRQDRRVGRTGGVHTTQRLNAIQIPLRDVHRSVACTPSHSQRCASRMACKRHYASMSTKLSRRANRMSCMDTTLRFDFDKNVALPNTDGVHAYCAMHAIRFAQRCVKETRWRTYDTTPRRRQ